MKNKPTPTTYHIPGHKCGPDCEDYVNQFWSRLNEYRSTRPDKFDEKYWDEKTNELGYRSIDPLTGQVSRIEESEFGYRESSLYG